MSKNRDYNVIFRESKDLVTSIDEAASNLGINRSSYIREAVRARLRGEADSALERYKKFR